VLVLFVISAALFNGDAAVEISSRFQLTKPIAIAKRSGKITLQPLPQPQGHRPRLPGQGPPRYLRELCGALHCSDQSKRSLNTRLKAPPTHTPLTATHPPTHQPPPAGPQGRVHLHGRPHARDRGGGAARRQDRLPQGRLVRCAPPAAVGLVGGGR